MNGKKHQQEIIRWAKCPDGTKVWFKKDNEEWELLVGMPSWSPNFAFIVDDAWATLRKAQFDGAQLQFDRTPEDEREEFGSSWKDRTLPDNGIGVSTPWRWRIKPEPTYEYQWLYLRDDGKTFDITIGFHKDEKEFHKYTGMPLSRIVDKYLPSKRVKVEDDKC